MTSHQLDTVREALNIVNSLAGPQEGSEQSLCGLLRQSLGLIGYTPLLSAEEHGLIDQLIARVYPGMGLQQTAAGFREPEPPEHVTTQWVIDYLDISRSTFYAQVYKHLLTPVKKIGNRPYYLKSEVADLMVRHEKGQWTYSKMRKLKEKEKKEAKKQKKKATKK